MLVYQRAYIKLCKVSCLVSSGKIFVNWFVRGFHLDSIVHQLVRDTVVETIYQMLLSSTIAFGMESRSIKLINVKKLQFIHTVNGDGSKTAKIIKRQS